MSNFNYDVFLSHSSKDKSVVRELAERLKADGVRVWFDEWEIKPGDMIGKKIKEGLEASRVLVLAMSKNISEEEWATFESWSFRFRDTANMERRLVPVRIDNSPIKNPFKGFAFIDWKENVLGEYKRLLSFCKLEVIETQQQPIELEPLKELVISRHKDSVYSVAMSSDGKFALSGSLDCTLRFWDLENGICVKVLKGHTEGVNTVAISVNGKLALSGSYDKTLKLWDLENGTCLKTLKGHKAYVRSVAICKGKKIALSGSFDGTLKLWDLESGKCLKTLKGHKDIIYSVAISADGKFALSSSMDNTLRLWNVKNGKCLKILKGHIAYVRSVAIRDDGKLALSGSFDETLKLWDLENGTCLKTLEGHKDGVNSVAISLDGKFALSGSFDETLKLWDLESGKCLKTLKGHKGTIYGVAISDDGKLTLSGSDDMTVRLWDLENGKCLKTLEGHTDSVRSVAIRDDGKLALSGSFDETLKLWDLENGTCLKTLEGHKNRVNSVAISLDGKFALSGASDMTVRLWDLENGTCLKTLKGHKDIIYSVAISADGKFALSGSSDETLKLWNVKNGKCLKTLEGHTDSVRSVAIRDDGKLALSGSFDETLKLWDLENGTCLKTLEGHKNRVNSVAISLDGKFALSGASDMTVRLWDLENGTCLKTLEGHTDGVNSVAISADGKFALSGSSDETLKLWDLESGTCLETLKRHAETMYNVALSKDGKFAYSSKANGIAQIWPLQDVVTKATRLFIKGKRYTNAKVLLVGDSGVGKSGLALRLVGNRFEPTISTDAAWATQLKLPYDTSTNDIEREIWLWDFAGQADYRLIHQLYMNDTSLAILVFNPQNQTPFDGLGQWNRALEKSTRKQFQKLLVAGRCDRGDLIVSRKSIEIFCEKYGFVDFIETSALLGEGCDKLLDSIVSNIKWENIPWTSSPRIFKLLKDEIINLRDEGWTLLRMSELKQQLELRLSGEKFTLDECRAVVTLLSGPGIVWTLDFGDFVLLQPERINSYATAVFRSVRDHAAEIGYIEEERVVKGDLTYKDMKRLPQDEEKIILLAMHQLLVERGLCLREPTDTGNLLIFPSLFKGEMPRELLDHPSVFVSFKFSGDLDEIYATLVVKLHHTYAFKKNQLWLFAADFKTHENKHIGFKMIKSQEGNAEIIAYSDLNIPDDTKVTFFRYIHNHLYAKSSNVEYIRHYTCGHCGTPVENRNAIQSRLSRGLEDIICINCEKRVLLLDMFERSFESDETKYRARNLEEEARTKLDNESLELILVGQATAIAAEAGHIFRPTPNSDWGIDGEIEFKAYDEESKNYIASGKRVYLQLKSGDSYLYQRRSDDKEIFTIKNPRHAKYWQQHNYDVMLVIRTSDKQIRWMNVTEYLRKQKNKSTKQIVFDGEPFNIQSLGRMKDKLIPPSYKM